MRDTGPKWARWSGPAAARPWTVGIEEEVILLDPHGWSVANRIDEALSVSPRDVAGRASAETHACVLEEHPGYERQRAYAACHGLEALSARLAADFAVPGLLTVAARAGSEVAR